MNIRRNLLRWCYFPAPSARLCIGNGNASRLCICNCRLMPRRQRDCVDCAESGESSLIRRVSGHLQACPVADPSGPRGKLSRIMSEVKAISPDILFVAGWSGADTLSGSARKRGKLRKFAAKFPVSHYIQFFFEFCQGRENEVNKEN